MGRGPGRGQSLGKSRVSRRRDLGKHERKFTSPLNCTALQLFLFMHWIRIAVFRSLAVICHELARVQVSYCDVIVHDRSPFA